MTESKTVQEQLDVFNKLIHDLENIGVEVKDEDQAFMLLCALPDSYDNFRDTLLYGRESLSMSDVQSALMTKELRRLSIGPSGSDEGLSVVSSGRTRGKEKKGNRGDDSGTSAMKCYHYKKKGHIQRNCPVLRNEKEQFTGSSNLAADDSDYDCADGL